MAELTKRDLGLLDFFGLGFHALRVLIDGDDASDAARIARQNVDAVIERYSLDGAALRELVAPGWDGGRRDEALSDELVGRFYLLAGIAIWPLPKQERVCFVIMPFSEPSGATISRTTGARSSSRVMNACGPGLV